MKLVLSEGGLMFGFMFAFMITLFGGIMLEKYLDLHLSFINSTIIEFGLGILLTFPLGLAFTGFENKNYNVIWIYESKQSNNVSQKESTK